MRLERPDFPIEFSILCKLLKVVDGMKGSRRSDTPKPVQQREIGFFGASAARCCLETFERRFLGLEIGRAPRFNSMSDGAYHDWCAPCDQNETQQGDGRKQQVLANPSGRCPPIPIRSRSFDGAATSMHCRIVGYMQGNCVNVRARDLAVTDTPPSK